MIIFDWLYVFGYTALKLSWETFITLIVISVVALLAIVTLVIECIKEKMNED